MPSSPVASVPSTTTDQSYEIVQGRDGRVYCTCPAWKFSRPPAKNCKHLDALRAALAIGAPASNLPGALPARAAWLGPDPAIKRFIKFRIQVDEETEATSNG